MHKNRKISSCQGLRGWEWEGLLIGKEFPFGVMKIFQKQIMIMNTLKSTFYGNSFPTAWELCEVRTTSVPVITVPRTVPRAAPGEQQMLNHYLMEGKGRRKATGLYAIWPPSTSPNHHGPFRTTHPLSYTSDSSQVLFPLPILLCLQVTQLILTQPPILSLNFTFPVKPPPTCPGWARHPYALSVPHPAPRTLSTIR